MNHKGVVMISGGLDSTLAAKILLKQGIELCGVYLSAPWGCCDKTKAMKVASSLGIDFMVVKPTEEYIRMLRAPKFGYGANMNPCIDCRIYMFHKAKELMAQVGADFLVTGEVLGQRPMSQMRPSLTLIEEEAGLKGRVVRPLSAKLLPPTLAEEAGIIDREKLYDISGRSRKVQMELAIQFGILEYPNAAGGCLLTDPQFSIRVKDLFDHQEEIDLEDMEMLRIGRHFRIDNATKLIVGRNEQENVTLVEYLAPGRVLFEPDDFPAPSVLLVGPPNDAAELTALRMIAAYTRPEKRPSEAKVHRKIGLPRGEESTLLGMTESVALGQPLENAQLEEMRIG